MGRVIAADRLGVGFERENDAQVTATADATRFSEIWG